MRKNVATLLIVLFSISAVTSFSMLGGIVRQWQALEMSAELAQATMVHDDKMYVVLSRIDDFDQYRKISIQMISGRTGTLKGIANLSEIMHTNIHYFSIGLLLSLSGLLITGLAMYLRLRSCMQKLACADGRPAI
jgi:hypothetical protein